MDNKGQMTLENFRILELYKIRYAGLCRMLDCELQGTLARLVRIL